MKKKFLALILAISMIPAPIASYAENDTECSKCKKELELCLAGTGSSISAAGVPFLGE